MTYARLFSRRSALTWVPRLACPAVPSFVGALALALCLSVTCDAVAQSSTSKKVLLDPRTFGFDIPPGELKRSDQRVVTPDEAGSPVVARTHVQIGDARIVLLPDGQLVARKGSQAEPTERPFEPISKEALVERLQATEFKNFKVKQSKHYVYLYTTSEEFAFGTGKILETMLPGVKKYLETLKIEVREPDLPLVVIMFRTEQDFQNYRRMPEGVVAYYDTLSNRVVMFEESARFGARRDLAIQQAISTIAHEGTHQILHNLGVQQRLSVWPMWISEGMAEFLAPTSVGKKLQWKGAAQVNDLRMFELEQYVKAKSNDEPNGDTVAHTVLAARLTSTGYASAWSLTHYLATKRRAEFTRYLGEVAKLGPLEGAVEVTPPGVVEGNKAIFEKHFGSDYVELEKKLILHLRKLPYNDPFAGMPHFVAAVSYTEGRKTRREVATFHSPLLATKWVQEMAAKNPAIDPQAAEIRQFPNRAAAEQYARVLPKGN